MVGALRSGSDSPFVSKTIDFGNLESPHETDIPNRRCAGIWLVATWVLACVTMISIWKLICNADDCLGTRVEITVTT